MKLYFYLIVFCIFMRFDMSITKNLTYLFCLLISSSQVFIANVFMRNTLRSGYGPSVIRTQKSFAYEATALTIWLMVLNLIEQTLKSLSLIYFKTNEFIPHTKHLMRLHQAVANHLYTGMLTITQRS